MTQGRYRFGDDGDIRHIAGWALLGAAFWAGIIWLIVA